MGLRKKKQPPPNPAMETAKTPKWSLVDYSVIKDWFNYGTNRTMSGLKQKNAEDIKAAEMERDKKKQGRDWNTIVPAVAVIIIVGVVAFMLILQFGNTSQMSTDLASCKGAKATADAKLGVCQEQLEELQPVAREITPEINI